MEGNGVPPTAVRVNDLLSGASRAIARVLASPLLGLVLVMMIALLAWPRFGFASPSGRVSEPPDVRTVYLRDCATCHAPDGSGTTRGSTLKGQGAAGVDFMLTTGRMPLSTPGRKMKRSAPAYSPAVISALDAYIAALQPGGPAIPSLDLSTATLTAGGSLYREQCAACHQAAGEGGALLGQNSPSLVASTPTQVAEAVRNGPGTMPVFGPNALSDRDVASIARYVAALQHVDDPGGNPLGHLGALPEGAVALAAMALVIVALRRIGSRT